MISVRLKSLSPAWKDAYCALMLLAVIIPTTYLLPEYLDLESSDDNSYALVGQLIPRVVPLPNWEPLYSTWYSALFSLLGDPLVVFIRNAQILFCSSVLLLYTAARTLRAPPLFAFAIAWLYAISPAATVMFPKVYQCGLIVILATVVAAYFAKRPHRKLSLFATGASYLAFVRPEVTPLAIILWISTIVWHFTKTQRVRTLPASVVNSISLALLSLIPVIVFGSPIFVPAYNRSFEAFGQGFVLNLARFAGLDISPYAGYRTVVHEYFGRAQSVWEAALISPSWFVQHVVWNTTALISAISDTARAPWRVLLVTGSSLGPPSDLPYYWSILSLVVVGITGSQIRLARRRTSEPLLEFLFVGATLACLVGGSLLTITDFRHGLLIVILFTLLLPTIVSIHARRWWAIAPILCALLSLLNLLRAGVGQPPGLPNVEAVRMARSLLSQGGSLTICPGYLAPYVDRQFAVPRSQNNSFVDQSSLRSVVAISSRCLGAESRERHVSQFESEAAPLGYRNETPQRTAQPSGTYYVLDRGPVTE